jgi:hypothetical protein
MARYESATVLPFHLITEHDVSLRPTMYPLRAREIEAAFTCHLQAKRFSTN